METLSEHGTTGMNVQIALDILQRTGEPATHFIVSDFAHSYSYALIQVYFLRILGDEWLVFETDHYCGEPHWRRVSDEEKNRFSKGCVIEINEGGIAFSQKQYKPRECLIETGNIEQGCNCALGQCEKGLIF